MMHVVQIPYQLYFSFMTSNTESPPIPAILEEALLAACYAQLEKQLEDRIDGPDWTYFFQTALPAAHRLDGLSAPKSIGVFTDGGAPGGLAYALINFTENIMAIPPISGNPIQPLGPGGN